MVAVSLIVVGVVFIIAGIVFFPKQHKLPDIPDIPDAVRLEIAIDTAIADGVLTGNEIKAIRKIAQDNLSDADLAVQKAEERMAGMKIKAETAMIDQNTKSGDDFEKYIVKKFDRQYFRIKNWAGDKYVEGRYAETTPQPDLMMEFHLKGESYPFSVECKWRKNDRNESFEFASETQLERYRKFESEKKIPVFVVIGLGGEAAEPEHLYIIPLKRLKYNFITLEYLEQFKKNMETEFFFDKETGDLK
jgi:hypothetical protein